MSSDAKQTHQFQTEVKELLHLVIHSLYSNKEIFMRELVSNASDALDKLRFLALSNADFYENDSDLKIEVRIDKDNKQIIIKDNGVGMTADEVVRNLGTIAKSGTKEFLSHLTGEQSKDSNLIGQFGVGFYSAFIVADRVTVLSRKAGAGADEAVEWSSEGKGEFTLKNIRKESRGTEVILHLKDEENEFLNNWTLKNLITKYSDHICWPIVMEKEVYSDSEDEEKDTKKEAKVELETVNKATALWTMQKSDIKDEEYHELYKHISHDFEAPLSWAHNHVEGKSEYISLLYIPARAPFDLWQQDSKTGLKLYVKRVFIMDDAEQFLPRYLRFVKGIIDSSDLALNVSREILQDNKVVQNLKNGCTKRALGMIEKLAKGEKESFEKFWDNFGQVLKEGIIEDYSNKEKISKLLRFSTTYDNVEKQRISLDDYISRMKEDQEKIYYITASSFNAAKNSPHLEVFRKKGIEVLLLSDRVDEWLVSHMSEYEGKSLQSITQGELDLKEEKDEAKEKEQEANFSSLVKHVKEILGDKVKEVRLTHRLTDSPACIVADSNDMGLEMQRIMMAAGQAAPETKPIFELNPEHSLIARLNQETDDERFSEWAHVLLDQAILAEGGELKDAAAYVNKINKLLTALSH